MGHPAHTWSSGIRDDCGGALVLELARGRGLDDVVADAAVGEQTICLHASLVNFCQLICLPAVGQEAVGRPLARGPLPGEVAGQGGEGVPVAQVLLGAKSSNGIFILVGVN